jgi:hypothetical protein
VSLCESRQTAEILEYLSNVKLLEIGPNRRRARVWLGELPDVA